MSGDEENQLETLGKRVGRIETTISKTFWYVVGIGVTVLFTLIGGAVTWGKSYERLEDNTKAIGGLQEFAREPRFTREDYDREEGYRDQLITQKLNSILEKLDKLEKASR